MPTAPPQEEFTRQEVTYVVEVAGRLFVVENVPARVSTLTGEKLFAPETVERVQAIVNGKLPPVRMISTPVYQFASDSK